VLRFRQSLKAIPGFVEAGFLDVEERPGEVWIGKVLFGKFEDDDQFAKKCGPLPE
jgi:hypothetical protein